MAMEVLEVGIDDGVRYSTGFMMLDAMLGGGLPRGVVEVYGNESTGKSALSTQIIGHCLRVGGCAKLYDQEDAFTPQRFEQLANVSLQDYMHFNNKKQVLEDSNFIPVRAETLEDVLADMPAQSAVWYKNGVCSDGAPLIFNLDSLAQTETKAEESRGYDKQEFSSTAATLSRNLKKTATATHKHGFIFLVVNQMREKVGVMFGDKNTTPGGKAIKFAAMLRLQLQNFKTLENGNLIKFTSKKNKVFYPFRTLIMPFDYDTGFSDFGAAVETLKLLKLATLSAKSIIVRGENKDYTFPKHPDDEGKLKLIKFAVRKYGEARWRVSV